MFHVLISLVAASSLVQPSTPQQASPPLTAQTTLAAKDLQTDLAALRRSYTELHPGLHRSNTPEQVARTFDLLSQTWSNDRTLREAFLDLSETLATFRCGHSYVNFFNQRKDIREALFAGRNRLPFTFRWLSGEMIVAQGCGNPSLTPGLRIRSINGAPASQIRDQLMKVARADGGNDAKRIRLLEVTGNENFETFDIYFPLYFPLSEPPIFALNCETLAGETITIDVPAVTAEERSASIKAASPAAPKSEFDFEINGWTARRLADHAVLFKMDTWAVYNSKWDWQAGLNMFMDKLAADGTRHLILDLRANEGGNDCGDTILARLIDRPIPLPSGVRHVRYLNTPKDLDPILDTWDDSFRDWTKFATRTTMPPKLLGSPDSGFFKLRRDTDDDPNATLKPGPGARFTGKLWVLTSPTNSSATFQFANAVKATKLGTLVGTPTGGNRRGINGGCFFFVRLPRTGFEVDLPLIAYTPSTPEGVELADVPDAGVEPDVPVTTTRLQLAKGEDPELRVVLDEISKSH